ncbi:MAG: hypothetical protein P8Q94_07085, partial [Candidatus Poseidoniaceae archaeon]|nr:hypothetical protein [Candidatus Poseidoniaceae archaeon]
WTSSCGGYGNGVGTGGPQCTSPDVTAILGSGEEMIIRLHEGGSYISELRVNYKDPSGTLGQWNPGSEGDTSNVDGSPSGLIFSTPGLYFFNLEDTWGDGANGGGFEVIKSQTGAWTATGNTNPSLWWDPGVAGLLTVEPGYRGPYVGYSYSPGTTPAGYSNTMDGILIQNNGADPVDYQLVGVDQWGDGWNGNYMRAQVAPVGTWTTSTTGFPPTSNNYGGPYGTSVAAIGTTASYANVPFTSGRYSAPVSVTLDAGYEMRFQMNRGGSYAGEVALQITEAMAPDNSWDGPTISNNDINFDSVNNNPNAIGLDLTNCDIQDYTITTQSNTIDIGQNAVVNNGCSWSDVGSTITGFDLSSSIGYNDDNTFNVDLSLDGTIISGFETGVYKTGGGILEITNSAIITAGDGGIGVHTDGIDLSVISATFDGGLTGTGLKVVNSYYAWLYPMDVTGNIGLHAVDSEILWDGGSTDASTSLLAENVGGTVQSITDTGGIQIDAQTDSRLTVIDFPLDETRMLVDATSIVDEANWLDIDANHLGSEPTASVGLSIISDGDYTAYSSPVFEGTMVADGDSEDWFGNNVLNPSGYAMPGAIGGPMYLTNDAGNLFFGLDSISSATSDVYIYIDSNDMAGSTTGFNGVHTLPYAADYAIVATSTSTDVYYYNDPAWVLDPTANAVSAEGSYLEISVPVSSIGGTSA